MTEPFYPALRLLYDGLCPALLTPDAEDIWNAAAGTLTDIDEVEHLQHGSVARVGDTTAFHRVDFNAETAGVGHGDGISLFDDDQSLSSIIVCIDQAVYQGFPERLMHGRIVHSCATVHILLQLFLCLGGAYFVPLAASVRLTLLFHRARC